MVEDDKVEFKLETEDDDAEVKWFKDGVEIVPDGKRYEKAQSCRSCNIELLDKNVLLGLAGSVLSRRARRGSW